MPLSRRTVTTLLLASLALLGQAAEDPAGIDWYRLDDQSLARSASAADEVALHEHLPPGASPDAAQRALVLAMARQVSMCAVRYDPDGQVALLWLSNHQIFDPKDGQDRPGVDRALIARLDELPALRALLVHHQPLADQDFAVLARLPQLQGFSVEYHGNHQPPSGEASGAFMLHLKDLRALRTLHLKHLFKLNTTEVDQLGPYPDLVCAELDNASAGPEAQCFLLGCPQLRDLELHRSHLSNQAIADLVDGGALRELRRLALKPDGGFDAGCLEHVARLPALERLEFHHWKIPLPWEGGLEHLVDCASLRVIDLKNALPATDPAAGSLAQIRPEIELRGLAQ
jgi:hypothetical protein